MSNPFSFIGGGKRYRTQNYMLRTEFGAKCIKVSLNAGLTCPNIDGTKGIGGCTYCLSGSGTFAGNPEKSLTEQFFEVKAKMNNKWHEGKYIPYFQSNTNTYTSLENLKRMFSEVLGFPDICAVAISTRADCITEENARFLSEINNNVIPVFTELGLQSISDKTASEINRCHTYDEFLAGYNILKKYNLRTCIHIINGLPGENHEMMMNTAKAVSDLKPYAVKIHLLHILKGTPMAKDYLNGKFEAMTLESYVNTVCDQLEILSPDITIERLTGDGAPDELIAPLWSMKKFVVMNEIDKEMRRRDSWQGKYYLN